MLELVGDAQLVLIGEASNGMHEFYEELARMTRRLIEEKGFCAVAIEEDCRDVYPVNPFIRYLFLLLRDLEGEVHGWELGDSYARLHQGSTNAPSPSSSSTGIVVAELIERVRHAVHRAAT